MLWRRLTLIAVLALAVAPAPAHAAFPGANGKLALQWMDSFNDGIHTENPDGTGDTWLTPDDTTAANPAWSADGTKIAFDSARGGNRDVYVMNADGSGVTQVTSNAAYDGDPYWSSDGTRLVFESGRDGNRELYVINADGSSPQRITNDPATDRDPSWSPDGTRIAFSSDREHFVCDSYPYCVPRATYRIFTMKPDGSDVTRVTVTRLGNSDHSAADHYHPDWSPMGDRIVYQWAEEDYFEEFFADRVAVTGSPDPYPIYGGTYPDSGQAWSPDGQNKVITYDYYTYVTGPGGGELPDCCSFFPSWQPIPSIEPGGFPRPKGATPIYVPLVPAYDQCSSPNSTHGSPLAFGSCGPPERSSANLTLGTPDANGKAANSNGFLQLVVHAGMPGGPDNSDVLITASVTSVYKVADLTDYTGELEARSAVRLTDKLGGVSSTTIDFPFSFAMPCSATVDPNVGGTCQVNTTADAIRPGLVPEGKRSLWQLSQAQIYDGGTDEVAATTGDNELFEVQGVFVP